MKCIEIQENLTEYLESSISENISSEVKSHLKSCDHCAKELEKLNTFLSLLNAEEIETPSKNLQANFDEMLAEEIKKNQPKIVQLEPKQNWKSYVRIAASIVIVVSAFLIGKQQSNNTKIANTEKTNKEEVLALLENTSASKRILAVANAEAFTKKDTKIIDALINTLLFDKNANVRLSAAEALSKFSSEAMVRDALIKSLETDSNSSVQIELIQILTKIQEKRALEPMQKMLKNEETPLYVKQQLELNLPSLL
jgi:HEAT repeat protein